MKHHKYGAMIDKFMVGWWLYSFNRDLNNQTREIEGDFSVDITWYNYI